MGSVYYSVTVIAPLEEQKEELSKEIRELSDESRELAARKAKLLNANQALQDEIGKSLGALEAGATALAGISTRNLPVQARDAILNASWQIAPLSSSAHRRPSTT